jgi:Sec-independent protein translocase protein TatA|tara:strand:+ start:1293 stop:1469 length:177 start_codon:yes stop_codon:yes gene_type:complete
MDSLPMISILVLVFTLVLLGEHMKLKKEVRRLTNLTKHLKNDIEKLKIESNQSKQNSI